MSMNFTRRLLENKRIQVYPEKVGRRTDPVVLMVRDELLVSQSNAEPVSGWLEHHGVTRSVLATLLSGQERDVVKGIEDVEIWKLQLPDHIDIVDVVRGLRGSPGAKLPDNDWKGPAPAADRQGSVSPNHVLIPAALSDACPSGPPSPLSQVPLPGQARWPNPRGRVSVIDSGYQWQANWAVPNPLASLCHLEVHPGFHATPAGWQPDSPDVPDANGDHRLDALAGHANFVAGIVAQRCPWLTVTVWNHNGSFVEGTPVEPPTEAAVCRSLIQSQLTAPARVIVVGFAFAALDDIVSPAWSIPFEAPFGETGDFVVVAPAGNQHGSTIPRYPAALNHTYPGHYPRVIGVASHARREPGTPVVPSEFSNVGPWVSCSTDGEHVASTFLHVDMPPEEDPAQPDHDFRPTSWATWNGTSFAGPKVAARIATRLHHDGGSALAAWEAVKATGTHDPAARLGVIF